MTISNTITEKFNTNLKATNRDWFHLNSDEELPETLELTPLEKLEVLVEARKLMDGGYASGDWEVVVEGIERFCMYGALQRTLGVEPGDAGGTKDPAVSACSLTSTLFEAIPDCWRKRDALSDIEFWTNRMVEAKAYDKGETEVQPIWAHEATEYERENRMLTGYVHFRISDAKVSALQAVNDEQGQQTVLAVFDAAMEKLRSELESN